MTHPDGETSSDKATSVAPYTPLYRVTGAEIVSHQFSQVRRNGYDPIEVDVFLERIATVIDQLNAEANERRGAEFKAVELLHHAQEVADRIIRTAEMRAALITEQASTLPAPPPRPDAESITVSAVTRSEHEEPRSIPAARTPDVVDLRTPAPQPSFLSTP